MDVYMGTVLTFAFNYAPSGWALCNGQIIGINQNQALFALLGTVYGGNGQQTFGLPNLQSRLPICQGNGPGLTPRVMGKFLAPSKSPPPSTTCRPTPTPWPGSRPPPPCNWPTRPVTRRARRLRPTPTSALRVPGRAWRIFFPTLRAHLRYRSKAQPPPSAGPSRRPAMACPCRS